MNKSTFFEDGRGNHFFDDLAEISRYCKVYWPEDVEHILRVANEVSEGIFLFDLKWDMERTYEPVVFHDEIDWRYMPGNDPEFIYQFNRHRYFICLGQAYALTGDEKYAKTFVDLLVSFIEKEPITKEGSTGTTWRTIEAGLRGEYWTKAIRYFKDSPYLTDEVIDLFYGSLLEHGEYLARSYSPYKLMSNWGVLENHGLFEIAMLVVEKEKREEWLEIAIERLKKEIMIQVMPDGVHWEQSPMYHNEVLHCYQDVLILALRNNIELPKIIHDKVKAMSYANVAAIKPNSHQVMQGDSDDTDIRDLISVSAYLFQDEVLKNAGYYRLDYESVWDLGIVVAREYQRMFSKKPNFTSIALNDSGNYYMRTGWGEKDNYMHFHCGTLGAGHGHSDKLHIDLFAHGEDILVDGGRYTYVSGEDRYEFKDPTMHNTITVDDELFTVCKDSWECSKLTQPVKQNFYTSEKFDFVQGGHLGYMDMEPSVFLNRKIIHIKPNIYILVDEMYTSGEHRYQQYFHFNEEGSLQFIDKDSIKSSHSKLEYKGKNAVAHFHFLKEDVKSNLFDSKISRNYNKYVKNQGLKNEIHGNGFCSAVTVIIAESGDKKDLIQEITVNKLPVKSALKGTYYQESQAEGVEIITKDNHYIVSICHMEVNSPTDLVEVNGCIGFGNVIVFEPKLDKEIGTVLNY